MYSAVIYLSVCSSVNYILSIHLFTKPQFHLLTSNHSFEITLFLPKLVIYNFY